MVEKVFASWFFLWGYEESYLFDGCKYDSPFHHNYYSQLIDSNLSLANENAQDYDSDL